MSNATRSVSSWEFITTSPEVMKEEWERDPTKCPFNLDVYLKSYYRWLFVAKLWIWIPFLKPVISMRNPAGDSVFVARIVPRWDFARAVNFPARATEMTVSPSRAAEYLLFLFLPSHLRDVIPGDLQEEFTTVILPKFGPRRARI